ncbi:protein kinase [Myxococcota bacterium]|nr:protein kinase [Myxococcota bacterium]
MAEKVLLVEADPKRRAAIRDALASCSVGVREVSSQSEALGALKGEVIRGLVVSDEARHLALKGLCTQVKRGAPDAPIFVLLTEGSDPSRVSNAAGDDAVLISCDSSVEQIASRVGSSLGARAPDVWRFDKLRTLKKGKIWEVHQVRTSDARRDALLTQLSEQFAQDDDLRAEFISAATEVATIEHACLPRVTRVGGAGDVPFVVWDCPKGETLTELMKRLRDPTRALSWRTAAWVASELAGALAMAHASGFLHAAVAPDNVWIGEQGEVMLLNLGVGGLCASLERGMRSQVGLATPEAHLAPEQIRDGQASIRTDVFLVGILLFELLSRRPLFLRDTVGHTREAVLNAEAPGLGDHVPAELAELVVSCLEKNPAYRPQTAASLKSRLVELVEKKTIRTSGAEDDTETELPQGGFLRRFFRGAPVDTLPDARRDERPETTLPGGTAAQRAELAALLLR